ncbi:MULTISPECIES: hypothetical protein [unclassified Pseudoclavibacter]|uniref:hypothetical protein n=1 Tax=unclassified Pseudoclavibacter TaxID=2615177 RepID=UPI001BA8080D|nr:hypothetical protein [Pseudoclavibacter sp. Marseille-Q4354]MBS3177248.1 hypothetical protein [Pseudoclavibacter sp. Marseille-Q4354]
MHSLLTEPPDTRQHLVRARARKRRSRSRWGSALIVTVMAAGSAMVLGAIAAPDLTEQLAEKGVGQVRHVANAVSVELAQAADPDTEQLPTVTLGELGPDALLDVCATGVFPELESYRTQDGLQPVFAAHNNCGGDVILPLQLGQRVAIIDQAGTASTYQVTELRDVDKHTATTEDVTGMAGSLLLQTCHWGDPIMRFVALQPAADR